MAVNIDVFYPHIEARYHLSKNACIGYGNEHLHAYATPWAFMPESTIAKIYFLSKAIFWCCLKQILCIPSFFVDQAIVARSCYIAFKARRNNFRNIFIAKRLGNSINVCLPTAIIVARVAMSMYVLIDCQKKSARAKTSLLLRKFAVGPPCGPLGISAQIARNYRTAFSKIWAEFTTIEPYNVLFNSLVIGVVLVLTVKFPFSILSNDGRNSTGKIATVYTPIRTRSCLIAGKKREIFNTQDFPEEADIATFAKRSAKLHSKLLAIWPTYTYNEEEEKTIEKGRTVLRQMGALIMRSEYLNAGLKNKQSPPVTALEKFLSLIWTGFSVQHTIVFAEDNYNRIDQILARMRKLIIRDPEDQLRDYWTRINLIIDAMSTPVLKSNEVFEPYQEFQKEIACGLISPKEFLERYNEIGITWFEENQDNVSYPEIKAIIALAKELQE